MRDLYPAKELIILYHERWEQELVFDQQKTTKIPAGDQADEPAERDARGGDPRYLRAVAGHL